MYEFIRKKRKKLNYYILLSLFYFVNCVFLNEYEKIIYLDPKSHQDMHLEL